MSKLKSRSQLSSEIDRLQQQVAMLASLTYRNILFITNSEYIRTSGSFAYTPGTSGPLRGGNPDVDVASLRTSACNVFGIPSIQKMYDHNLTSERLVP